MGANSVGHPGVGDYAISLATVFVAQPSLALKPKLRQRLARQRPTKEASDPLVSIDDEDEMPASNLVEEHLRPFPELEFGEGRFPAQVLNRQAEGSRGAVRPPGAQDGVVARRWSSIFAHDRSFLMARVARAVFILLPLRHLNCASY